MLTSLEPDKFTPYGPLVVVRRLKLDREVVTDSVLGDVVAPEAEQLPSGLWLSDPVPVKTRATVVSRGRDCRRVKVGALVVLPNSKDYPPLADVDGLELFPESALLLDIKMLEAPADLLPLFERKLA